MIAYASRTTNARSLAAIRAAGWRVIISPATRLTHQGVRYALDNGAWSAFASGTPWDAAAFRAALRLVGPRADWVALPDIVEGGQASFELSMAWIQEVLDYTQVALLPVQDGMGQELVRRILGSRVGVFVGGSTAFKEQTMAMWAAMARASGAWCHVGRVNSRRRVCLCAAAGVDSFDGSSVSRYASTLPLLDDARRQPDLFAIVTH